MSRESERFLWNHPDDSAAGWTTNLSRGVPLLGFDLDAGVIEPTCRTPGESTITRPRANHELTFGGAGFRPYRLQNQFRHFEMQPDHEFLGTRVDHVWSRL